jgi:hypothetical protein
MAAIIIILRVIGKLIRLSAENAKGALKDNSAKGCQNRVAAWYNVGIYHEVHGDLDQAAELFDRCFKISGDSKYLDAKARVLARQEERKRLEQQQGGLTRIDRDLQDKWDCLDFSLVPWRRLVLLILKLRLGMKAALASWSVALPIGKIKTGVTA